MEGVPEIFNELNEAQTKYVETVNEPNQVEWKEFNGEKWLVDSQERAFIPPTFVKKYVLLFHERLMHPGSTKLPNTLKNYNRGKSLKKMIIQVTKNCYSCQESKRINSIYGLVSGII